MAAAEDVERALFAETIPSPFVRVPGHVKHAPWATVLGASIHRANSLHSPLAVGRIELIAPRITPTIGPTGTFLPLGGRR